MRLERETIVVLETSLDDCSPQVLGYVLERALERGALDAYSIPALMKKSRPGVVLTVLARPADQEEMVRLILEETPSLGVRARETERWVLPRDLVQVATEFGPLRVKVAGGNAMPEYEECRAAARRHHAPLRRVADAALAAWRARQP